VALRQFVPNGARLAGHRNAITKDRVMAVRF
jgi:hypothetical protein